MRAVLRSVLAVLLGIIVAGVLIALIEMVGHVVYPLPQGVDVNDRAALAEAVANMPLGGKLFVLLAWAVGTFWGAWVAARLAGRARLVHALIVGVLFLAGGISNMVLIPHPAWFWVAGVALFLPAAYLGAQLAMLGRREQPQPGMAA